MKEKESFLKKLNLDGGSILSRAELKKITGGESLACMNDSECATGECCSPWGYCGTTAEHCVCSDSHGTCGYRISGEGNWSLGLTQDCAMAMAARYSGHWCCDNCS